MADEHPDHQGMFDAALVQLGGQPPRLAVEVDGHRSSGYQSTIRWIAPSISSTVHGSSPRLVAPWLVIIL